MAGEQHTEQDAQAVAEEFAAEVELTPDEQAESWSSWANLWQAPAIIISTALIIAALFVAAESAPEHDFEGALGELEHALAAEHLTNDQLQTIASHLRETIQPYIDEATASQKGRYHALIGDWFATARRLDALDRDSRAAERIDEHYARAVELGITLSAAQLEDWAEALLQTGDLAAAQQRLDELDARDLRDSADANLRGHRNRVFRGIIEYTLRHGDLDDRRTLELLSEFRGDERVAPADRAWAVARQAEWRLNRREAQAAVDQLLIDMRRLEDAAGAMAERGEIGELYLLLGRGYRELGRPDDAAFFLHRADLSLPQASLARGEMLYEQAMLALAANDIEPAEQLLTSVIDHYAQSHVLPAALLARGEARSRMGGHQASRSDYQALIPHLGQGGSIRDVSVDRVAESLVDRHDVVLAMGRLDEALQYAALAESLFTSRSAPPQLLNRLAATHRQIAENTLAAGKEQVESADDAARVPPKVRYEASQHFGHAADYFIRHARAIAGLPNEEDAWAQSLWLAGECQDLAGRPDKAAEIFIEFLNSRPIDDPLRPDVMFRLAQARQSQADFGGAAESYAQLIDEHPRSPQATLSHVPLARCLVAVDQRPEAVRRLRQVLAGEHPISPDAQDYRDALIALGTIHYEAAEHGEAIAVLHQALDRYPDDPQRMATQFMLGDAYRRSAVQMQQTLDTEPNLTPARRIDLHVRRLRAIESAASAFDAVLAAAQFVDLRRDAVARLHARGALLYRADCAYRLGRYEQAIELFDRYARQHSDHHSSMTALIQIVNCYEALGQTQKASQAHDRAAFRLAQLPDHAFSEPDALMDRAAWERWLRNRPVGLQASAANTGN